MRLGHVLAPGGISREMLLGAAVAAGAGVQAISAIVERLGCHIQVVGTSVDGLTATHVMVEADPITERAESLEAVSRRIEGAGIDTVIAERAVQVYGRLFVAEGIIHGTAPESVRLHQLGGPRYPALIVATVASFHALAFDRVTVGTIALGSGSVETGDHGILPIPAPATCLLLQHHHVVGGPFDGELTGPTAAALVSTLTVPAHSMPAMTLQAVGRGAGRIETSHPGYTTLLVGSTT